MDILSFIPTEWIWFSVGIVVFVILVTILATRWMRSLGSGGIKNGVTAPATIVRMWDTGTTMNDNPLVGFELDVHPQGQPAFHVEVKQLVSRIQIGAYLPGVPVQVMYDPTNYKRIRIKEIGSAAGMGGAAGAQGFGVDVSQLQQSLLARDQLLEAVRSMGTPAEATILRVTDMGITVGDAATLKKLDLEVRPANLPPFHAETQGAISNASNDKYQAGKVIHVKYNPNDLTQVAIDRSS